MERFSSTSQTFLTSMAYCQHVVLMVFLTVAVAAVVVFGFIVILFEVTVRFPRMEAMASVMLAEEQLVE